MTDPAQTPKQGLSPLAWVGIGCAGLLVVGLISVSLFIGWGAKKVGEIVDNSDGNPGMAAAEMLIRMNPETDFIESDSETGMIKFFDHNSGKELTLNFEEIQEGKFTVSTEEGDIVFNAEGDEDNGSFTITGPDGKVLVDAQGSEGDGTVTIAGPDGNIVLNAEGSEGDGTVTITGPDGQVVVDAEGSGEDGTVTFTSPDGQATIASGANAAPVPGWVPVYPGSSTPEATYSAQTSDGLAGGFTTTTTDAVDKVKDYYTALLKREGYEVSTQSANLASGEEQASVVGTDEGSGRSLTVVIGSKEGEDTSINILFGDKDE